MTNMIQTQSGDRERGAKGGAAPGLPVRKHLQFLRLMLDRGELAAEHLDDSIEFAVAVRNDPSASARDRIRAAEFIRSVADRAMEAAIALDKIDRLDGGEATDNAAITIRHVQIPVSEPLQTPSLPRVEPKTLPPQDLPPTPPPVDRPADREPPPKEAEAPEPDDDAADDDAPAKPLGVEIFRRPKPHHDENWVSSVMNTGFPRHESEGKRW